MSTTDSIPGHEVTALVGAVVGVITQPRDLKPGPELSVTLTEIRQDAVNSMVTMAAEAGADAVVGLHFDTGPISGATSEVVAYGTAVKLDGQPRAEIDPDAEAANEAIAAAEIEGEVDAIIDTLQADPSSADPEASDDTTISAVLVDEVSGDSLDPRLAGADDAAEPAEPEPAPKPARRKAAK